MKVAKGARVKLVFTETDSIEWIAMEDLSLDRALGTIRRLALMAPDIERRESPLSIGPVEDAVGFIDQTLYANEETGSAWTNAEVVELLGMIRGKLLGEAAIA